MNNDTRPPFRIEQCDPGRREPGLVVFNVRPGGRAGVPPTSQQLPNCLCFVLYDVIVHRFEAATKTATDAAGMFLVAANGFTKTQLLRNIFEAFAGFCRRRVTDYFRPEYFCIPFGRPAVIGQSVNQTVHGPHDHHVLVIPFGHCFGLRSKRPGINGDLLGA